MSYFYTISRRFSGLCSIGELTQLYPIPRPPCHEAPSTTHHLYVFVSLPSRVSSKDARTIGMVFPVVLELVIVGGGGQ